MILIRSFNRFPVFKRKKYLLVSQSTELLLKSWSFNHLRFLTTSSSLCDKKFVVHHGNEVSEFMVEKFMDNIRAKKKGQHHINLKTVRKACNSLIQTKMMDEANGILLISLCGNQMDGEVRKKSDQAQAIFDVVEPKTTALVNELLQVMVDNDAMFSPKMILRRLDELGLIPNQDTFVKLIAGSCVKGKLSDAYQILVMFNDFGFKIPAEVYGYFSLGLCMCGSYNQAVKLMEEFSHHWPDLNWDVYQLLFTGLATAKSNHMFLETFDKLAPKFGKKKMTIFQAVLIYKALLKGKSPIQNRIVAIKYKEVLDRIFQYVELGESDSSIEQAAYLLKSNYASASFFLKQLLLCCNVRYNGMARLFPMLIILLDAVENGKKFDDLWDTVLFLKSFDRYPPFVEYLTLSTLIKQNSNWCRRYLDKLAENDIYLKDPLPKGFEKIDIPPDALTSLLTPVTSHNNRLHKQADSG